MELFTGPLVKQLSAGAIIIGSIVFLYLWTRWTHKAIAKEIEANKENIKKIKAVTVPNLEDKIDLARGGFELMRDERETAWKEFLTKADFELAMKVQQETQELKMNHKVLEMQSAIMTEIQEIKGAISHMKGDK